ncbi:MAG: hypothetical protein K0Q55_3448 [Verrucomicrobia bacterium]|jgi:hypothetical protein|nr:hypothetical protein [Verrucomicrobiota bacterium]
MTVIAITALLYSADKTKSAGSEYRFDPKKNILSKQTLWIIEKPDSFVLLSLGPDTETQNWAAGITNAPPIKPKPEMLGRWEILGSTAITNRNEQQELISSLQKSLQLSAGKRYACFDPHHALRMKRDDKSTDLIICFQCVAMHENNPRQRILWIDHSQRTNFDAVLIRHGLPIATNRF